LCYCVCDHTGRSLYTEPPAKLKINEAPGVESSICSAKASCSIASSEKHPKKSIVAENESRENNSIGDDSLDDLESDSARKYLLRAVPPAPVDRDNHSLGFDNISYYSREVPETTQFITDSILDIAQTLTNQKRLQKRMYAEQQLRSSGLSLLATGGGNDLVGGSVSSVSGLMSTSSAHDTDDSKSLSIKDAKSAKILLKATKSIGSFPLLQRTLSYGVSKKKNFDNMDASVIEEDAKQCVDFPYRHISKLSTHTNLKYMHVGDRGVELIYDGLCNNAFITDIVLVNSGLTSVGVTLICSAAVTLSNLVYLDLSQNAIDDECANVICQIIYDPEEIVEKVETMPGMLSPASSKREKVTSKPKSTVCKSLQKLSLCGNRFTFVGVKKIVETVLQDTCAVAHLRFV
jgi:hypothetical protein